MMRADAEVELYDPRLRHAELVQRRSEKFFNGAHKLLQDKFGNGQNKHRQVQKTFIDIQEQSDIQCTDTHILQRCGMTLSGSTTR